MDEGWKYALGYIAVFLACMLLGWVVYEWGYHDGQIDALSGRKVKYELIQNEKGETVWGFAKEGR